MVKYVLSTYLTGSERISTYYCVTKPTKLLLLLSSNF
jgi:hypothetical protein